MCVEGEEAGVVCVEGEEAEGVCEESVERCEGMRRMWESG